MRHCSRVLATVVTLVVNAAMLSVTSLPATALMIDSDLQDGATRTCRQDVTPSPARTQASPSATKVLPPEDGAYLGLYQIPLVEQDVESYVSSVGTFPPIVYTMHDWYNEGNPDRKPDRTFDDPMEGDTNLTPLQMAEYLRRNDSVLALAWAVYCCDIYSYSFWFRIKKPHNHVERILAGEHDDLIRETARKIRDWGGPIMLTVMAEVNWQGRFLFGEDGRQWLEDVDDICGLYGDPTWPDGPERVRDMFIHVIDIFREEGADNVTWFMYAASQYMVDGVDDQSVWLHPRFYYPGDDYIDWVGQSAYYLDPSWPGDFEDTGAFDDVFGPGYEAWRSVTSRPMLLPEFGIVSSTDQDRRALWQETVDSLLPAYPGVAAVTIADSLLFELYFNLPRISERPGESAIIREALDGPTYHNTVRIGGPDG